MSQRLHIKWKLGQDHHRRMQEAAFSLDSLSPDTVVSGSDDLTLSCIGSSFNAETIIKFGDFDEPTTLVSSTEVTTIVKPSLFAPAVVPVQVHNGPVYSAPLYFSFTEPVTA